MANHGKATCSRLYLQNPVSCCTSWLHAEKSATFTCKSTAKFRQEVPTVRSRSLTETSRLWYFWHPKNISRKKVLTGNPISRSSVLKPSASLTLAKKDKVSKNFRFGFPKMSKTWLKTCLTDSSCGHQFRAPAASAVGSLRKAEGTGSLVWNKKILMYRTTALPY